MMSNDDANALLPLVELQDSKARSVVLVGFVRSGHVVTRLSIDYAGLIRNLHVPLIHADLADRARSTVPDLALNII